MLIYERLILYENDKLSEAHYFMALLRSAKTNLEVIYLVNALLAAGGSLLDFAYRETKKTGGRPWLEAKRRHPILMLCRALRNITIHESPIEYAAFLGGADLSMNAMFGSPAGSEASSTPQERPVIVSNAFIDPSKIKDYPRAATALPNGILEICQAYVDELSNIVSDGITNAYISG